MPLGRVTASFDVFAPNGDLLQRLVSRGQLDSPWAVTMAPSSFGAFGGDILVGNFGSGHINAYDPATVKFQGELRRPHGGPITIDGLWGIGFGNDGLAGPSDTLYFAAGPDDEANGYYGSIAFTPKN